MVEKIKNGITELVFILDRSGTMSGLESDSKLIFCRKGYLS